MDLLHRDDEIEIINNEINPIVAQSKLLTIASPEDQRNATEILSKLNSYNDRLIEDKERITKPLNAALKEVRSKYKPLETLLDTAIEIIRSKMGTYQALALKTRKDAEDKIAARIGDGKGKLQLETAVVKIDALDLPQKTLETDSGEVTFVTVKKFAVEEIALLPLEYHLPDEIAIRKKMKEGVELPGVRYFEEQSVRNSR